jgi:hypothetical protein
MNHVQESNDVHVIQLSQQWYFSHSCAGYSLWLSAKK